MYGRTVSDGWSTAPPQKHHTEAHVLMTKLPVLSVFQDNGFTSAGG